MRTSKSFLIEHNQDLSIRSIAHPDDPHEMNWMESPHRLGETVAPSDLEVTRQLDVTDERMELTVTFHNPNHYDVFLQKGILGVYVPFNDSYGKASICMTQRCHAHLNLCGSASWIMGLRMGGISPHLGMLLTEGELVTYSIERENKSNDRGDFLLHPPFVHLLPKQSYTLKMEFFWHDGKEDFLFQIGRHTGHIRIESEHFTYFVGETATVHAICSDEIQNATVMVDGVAVPFTQIEKTLSVALKSTASGERQIVFCINGKTAIAKLWFSTPIDTLVAARCRYIVQKQQFNCVESALDGAYLTFDTEEETPVYDYRRRDINSSRERICMALLILLHLKRNASVISKEEYETLHNSLMRFTTFFKREIYDPTKGTVTNDIGYENSKVRLYNYPWPTRFFLELYELENDPVYLRDAYSIMRQYYALGGKNFYAFTIPILRMCECLERGGMMAERDEMITYFREHAEVMIANASDYPAHEVSYEQSIVAPAAEFLLQMYRLTKEPRYLQEADKQLATAELFSGVQPDYHLYQCAIRHWDGFWFGKRRLYGDTFPHYWSVLSANVFHDYGIIHDRIDYLKMAEDAFRGQLCQFTEDGRATCATLFPFKVNGNTASYRDPWANDQDWALVYYLDYLRESLK